jgi:hypothetical protein
MTILKEQRKKVIKELEKLVEDASHESYESRGMESIDDIRPYYLKICKILNIVNP